MCWGLHSLGDLLINFSFLHVSLRHFEKQRFQPILEALQNTFGQDVAHITIITNIFIS